MIFNADEVFALAEQIERNGQRFYALAAEQATDEAVKKVLTDLAVWEEAHEETFAKLRARLTDQDAFDPEGEAEAYLQAIAGSYIFDTKKHPSETITGSETPQEILTIALAMEKEAILFYVGLQEAMPDGLGKDEVRAIVTEEMGHVVYLNRLFARLA